MEKKLYKAIDENKYSEIVETLKELAHEHELSYRELAFICQVDKMTIYKFFKKYSKTPNLHLMCFMIDFFDNTELRFKFWDMIVSVTGYIDTDIIEQLKGRD